MEQLNETNYPYFIQVKNQLHPLNCLDCMHIALRLRDLRNGETTNPHILSGMDGLVIDVSDEVAYPMNKPNLAGLMV